MMKNRINKIAMFFTEMIVGVMFLALILTGILMVMKYPLWFGGIALGITGLVFSWLIGVNIIALIKLELEEKRGK